MLPTTVFYSDSDLDDEEPKNMFFDLVNMLQLEVNGNGRQFDKNNSIGTNATGLTNATKDIKTMRDNANKGLMNDNLSAFSALMALTRTSVLSSYRKSSSIGYTGEKLFTYFITVEL